MLSQKYALFLVGSGMYTTPLCGMHLPFVYHGTFAEVLGSGVVEALLREAIVA